MIDVESTSITEAPSLPVAGVGRFFHAKQIGCNQFWVNFFLQRFGKDEGSSRFITGRKPKEASRHHRRGEVRAFSGFHKHAYGYSKSAKRLSDSEVRGRVRRPMESIRLQQLSRKALFRNPKKNRQNKDGQHPQGLSEIRVTYVKLRRMEYILYVYITAGS